MAFERVSKVIVQPFEEEAGAVDIRSAKLPFVPAPADDYDPRDHRTPAPVIEPWMAYFNMLKTAIGAGMLGMPLSISNAGMILGPILMILIGLLVVHSLQTLLWCGNEISRQLKIPYISYRYGFRIAMLHGPPSLYCLGHIGPTIVAILMFLTQLGICSVMIVLIADNLKDIMEWDTDVPALMCLYFPYIILEILMKNFKRISYVAMAGNFVNVAGISLIVYAMFQAMVYKKNKELNYVAKDAVSFFVAFGTILYNLCAIGVILACEKALANPRIVTKRFGVIQIGIMIPTLVACFFGTMGHWSFGYVEENILRSLPYDNIMTIITFYVYTASITLTYPLQSFPGVNIILEVIKNHDSRVDPSRKCLTVLEYIGRPLFVTFTFAIAYYLPFQAALVAFTGNMCATLLILIFPALMEIGILYPSGYGQWNKLLIKNLIIVITAMIAWLHGIYFCGHHLYILYMAGPAWRKNNFA